MSEAKEVKKLMSQATYPGVRALLQTYYKTLTAGEPVDEDEPIVEAKPTPAAQNSASSTRYYSDTPVPLPSSEAPRSVVTSAGPYISVENFSWDQGKPSEGIVYVYAEIPRVGTVKDKVSVSFNKHAFDLKVHDLEGKNYRLLKDNLDRDIIPSESKFIVKNDKVVIKLKKAVSEYGFENWLGLTSKLPRTEIPADAPKPDKGSMDSVMNMMKEMYDDGDENMKKIIGEAMLKSKLGEKPGPPSMPFPDFK